MPLRRPNQGVITQSIPAFYPERMGVLNAAWSNGAINAWTPAGLYNNASDGSRLVVWSVDLEVAPSGAAPASYTPEVDWTLLNPNLVGSGGPAFRSIATVISGFSPTTIVPVPAPLTPGDLMVAAISRNDADAATLPAGWIPIASVSAGVSITADTYYKIAGASEPLSYTWTYTRPEWNRGAIAAYSNYDLAQPIDNSNGFTGLSTSLVSVPLTFTLSGCRAVVTYAHPQGGTGWVSSPAGMTLRAQYEVNQYNDLQLSGASIAAQTATIAGSDNYAGIVLGIRPILPPITLGSTLPLVAGSSAPWGKSFLGTQAAAQLGTLYYRSPCAGGVMTTSAGAWKWERNFPFAIIPPGYALLANLGLVSNGWLSMVYESTKGY
jgi:hypothetical protein